ncbi:TetR/AcrR family transcriptional regulator [Streptomyces sp. S1A1-8]|uniref:TetR/AcrR family transcriptional regulator n=2 Tax=Streptomyces TaxID=1883 RepID=UPI001161F18E|nr:MULTISPECIES: TetR/AcrR family transcriptional regulator [unclassified Streptomyces]QDN95259.1 TetR/AcrR family transcriptional regulator [Streptomyces sp. RLB1-9]QDO16983.1 TetR/AcrR family transcriptional regulator [Streptomyces sp. S1A1-8]QDO27106.1 TetR/AcrR family transcriptional regulator [Streptomyces sp. S1A1-3]QDN54555.1 TetR/AcrR family transcriptional regulator [Streptomyces sp. S1D4-20]QDN64737.1 TetR/AcrR family transcriptional regulator [Streptomyces sp. S1D4-14]
MTDGAQPTMRRDAVRNRERLLAAARVVFAERGADVALEEVARLAVVSRTTLYRHFTTREQLAATVFEENVALIERRAVELREADDGIVTLFDFVLDQQRANRGFERMLSAADLSWLSELSARTIAAFEPLLVRGRAAGIVHPVVGVDDVMLAFPMAAGAMADSDLAGRPEAADRVRAMLHRALFTGAAG